jgi:branched-chain amino acid aminotransferase
MSMADYSAGAAYVDGRYMPVGEASVPILDWGYRHSDATYDVVGEIGRASCRERV